MMISQTVWCVHLFGLGFKHSFSLLSKNISSFRRRVYKVFDQPINYKVKERNNDKFSSDDHMFVEGIIFQRHNTNLSQVRVVLIYYVSEFKFGGRGGGRNSPH